MQEANLGDTVPGGARDLFMVPESRTPSAPREIASSSKSRERRGLSVAWVLFAFFLTIASSFAFRAESRPLGALEASHLLLAQSLLEDGDLVITDEDLPRARRRGIAAESLIGDGEAGEIASASWLYVVCALPAVILFGDAGFVVFNALLWSLAAGLVFRRVAASSPEHSRACTAGMWVGGFFVGTAALAWVPRAEVFAPAGCFLLLGFLLLQRDRKRERLPSCIAAGLALVLAATLYLPLAVPAIAIGIAEATDRRWRSSALVLAFLTLALVGSFAWRARAAGRAPTELVLQTLRGVGASTETGTPRPWEAELGRRLLEWTVGRWSGWLPFFPFAALAALAFLRRGPRPAGRWIVALAVLAYAGAELLLRAPPSRPWGSDPATPHFAAIYPLLVALPVARPRWPATILAWGMAIAFVAPTVLTAFAGQIAPVRGHDLPWFRWLPPELERLAEGGSPTHGTRWIGREQWSFPHRAFWLDERHPEGLWMRGDSIADVVLGTPAPVAQTEIVFRSIDPTVELEVRSGAGPLQRVRFDSPTKRDGTRVEIALRAELATSALGETIYLHRIELRARGGNAPADLDPGSSDKRYLGVFLGRKPAHSVGGGI